MSGESEPSNETLMEIGRLCAAWSYLEARSEATLWGIVGADERLGPLITWRLDLPNRWSMILNYAPKKHDVETVEILRLINKDLTPVTRDRNIIVHGLVHAIAMVPVRPPYGTPLPPPHEFARIPCWTVFRGAQAGKNFAISSMAVSIVRENIQKIGTRVTSFNVQHGYTKVSQHEGQIENDWPKQIEESHQ